MPIRVLQKPASLARLRALPDRIKAGVAVKGPAAKYALVWEWGTVRFRHPGPKTTYGSNPDDGTIKIFTKTAPSGYIRIHKQQFYDMCRLAVISIHIQESLLAGNYEQALRDNIAKVTTEIAQIMAKDAPIDSGLLRESILAVSQPEVEAILQAAYRPLLIGGTPK